MFSSMSNQETPLGANDLLMPPMDPDPLRPPVPPKLMTLEVFQGNVPMVTWQDLTNSTLAAPTILRFELLDGSIVLMDMTGREFVLTPQDV